LKARYAPREHSQSGREQEAYHDARYITHPSNSNAGSGDGDTYEDIKAEFANMTLFMELLRNIYDARCSIPEERLDEMMSKYVFLRAGECLQYGIVDEII
jgi:ATP-dependent protease ClpP protease subunit